MSKETNSKVQQRILLVDDEEFVVLTLKESLEKLPNCEIVTATSSILALRLFTQEPFDLVITDYKMPNMDGVTLANHVHQLHPQTITIMVTAQYSSEAEEQMVNTPIRRILNKPVHINEIRHIATEALAELAISNFS